MNEEVKYYNVVVNKIEYQAGDIISGVLRESGLPKDLLFHQGSILKYTIRAGRKNSTNSGIIADMKKARDYCDMIIGKLEL